MDFRDDEIVVDKPLSDLDGLVVEVTGILEDVGVEYVVVSGYVAVLLGRARATEDIDVIVEQFDRDTAGELAEALEDAGFWGSAMPLDSMHETLVDGLPFRVAVSGDVVPNVELEFPTDEYDRASLEDTVDVVLSGSELRVGSLELQIAYKLAMGARKDFEDAVYLFEAAEPILNTSELEAYVEKLDVRDQYERL